MERGNFWKVVFGVLAIVLTSYQALASEIMISQVYYDPIATESGGEAIELYNPNNFVVSLQNYSLRTESADKDVTFGINHTIEAKGYFLVSDFGWSNLKDNKSWVDSDYEETMNMYNSDSGIALVDKNGNIVDSVGWGNKSLINDGLYENEPGISVKIGEVLLRLNLLDTNNNKNDFISATVQLRNSKNSSSSENVSFDYIDRINISVFVNNSFPVIESIALNDDNELIDGFQIMPNLWKNKTIMIEIIAADVNGADDLLEMKVLIITDHVEEITLIKNQSIDSTKALFNGEFSLNSLLKPKQYSLSATVFDNSLATAEKSVDFEYLSVVAFNFDSGSFSATGNANQTVSFFGDNDKTTNDKPTINNIGNVPLQFAFETKGLQNGKSIIGPENISYRLGNSAVKSFIKDLVFDKQTVLNPGQLINLDLFVTLPEVATYGNYLGEVTVYAFSV